MKNKNNQYINLPYRNAILQLIWSSNNQPEFDTTEEQNFVYLLNEIIAFGFSEPIETFKLDQEDKKIIEEIYQLSNKLVEKYDCEQQEITTKQKRNLHLPQGLQAYNDIAVPVIELFESIYKVQRDRSRGCGNVCCWKIADPRENKSAYLYLTTGFEWSISDKNGQEVDYFDVVEFCACNDVFIEDLYLSLKD